MFLVPSVFPVRVNFVRAKISHFLHIKTKTFFGPDFSSLPGIIPGGRWKAHESANPGLHSEL